MRLFADASGGRRIADGFMKEIVCQYQKLDNCWWMWLDSSLQKMGWRVRR